MLWSPDLHKQVEDTKVSEKYTASIFRREEWVEHMLATYSVMDP
jgi:hypothetical protein